MRAIKHDTLKLIRHKGCVKAADLVHHFDYSPATARSYLSYLAKQHLLQRTSAGHTLTERGEERLHFFEVEGCGQPACPRCEKKTGAYAWPTCGYQLDKKKAKIRPAWDTLFFLKDTGVYCPFCQGQIFTAPQARLLGIPEAPP